MMPIKNGIQAVVTAVVMVLFIGSATAQAASEGTEEFGLTRAQLVKSVEKVEALISKCMRDQGFQYVAADYNTVRLGMNAVKKLPGLSENEFIAKYGLGVSTLYTGQPPQLAEGYNPAKVGLGERNVQIYKNLSPTGRVAYNRALFGENADATFALALDKENFSRTGGCTRKAVEQVFKPEQLKGTYYSPKDALINKDPRMKAALRKYASEMRKAGFQYNHPDEVEPDLWDRLAAITNGGTIPVENMSAEQRTALKTLQDYERKVYAHSRRLDEEIIEPVEVKILEEMYARKPQ